MAWKYNIYNIFLFLHDQDTFNMYTCSFHTMINEAITQIHVRLIPSDFRTKRTRIHPRTTTKYYDALKRKDSYHHITIYWSKSHALRFSFLSPVNLYSLLNNHLTVGREFKWLLAGDWTPLVTILLVEEEEDVEEVFEENPYSGRKICKSDTWNRPESPGNLM